MQKIITGRSVLRFLLCIHCIIVCHTANFAQGYNPARISKKARASYEKALEKAAEGDFSAALMEVNLALEADDRFVEALLTKAGLHGERKEYATAVDAYEKAFAIDSAFSIEYLLPYSINLGGKGEFAKAVTSLNRFLSIPELDDRARKAALYRKRCFMLGDSLSKKYDTSSYVFAPKNLGDSVNSIFSEYYPSLTIDGKTIIFTRRSRGIDEDFYSSQYLGTAWGKAESLSENINTDLNEGAQNISQDGEWLIFTGCNFPEGEGNCDLYLALRNRQGWSRPKNLGYPVNSEAWESAPCLSPDKQMLFFASNRPGGLGGNDLYVSRRQSDGSWGDPENLGPKVNTAGNESCPFMHADGRTLYFTSDFHAGYGGDDLFVTQMEFDGTWDEIHNLGYPINTIENEGSLVVASDGRTAYYASDRSDSKGGLDIYTFQMRPERAPRKTLWVKGRVYDVKDKRGLPSAVELTDLEYGKVLHRVQTDEDGYYLATLPIGSDYGFHVRRKNYLFHSGTFPLAQDTRDTIFTLDIPLQPIERNAHVELKNLFFTIGSYQLESKSTAELDQLVSLLSENPSIRIRIEGHTDNIGKPQENIILSERRARAVVDYLIAKGIAKERLSSQGLGAGKPVADNRTLEGRAKNRRTELIVTEN